MCLFGTLDGCFMNFAYDWAFARPIRKVFYNITITGLSVFVAFHRHHRDPRPHRPRIQPDRRSPGERAAAMPLILAKVIIW
jgi:hypothetical protein